MRALEPFVVRVDGPFVEFEEHVSCVTLEEKSSSLDIHVTSRSVSLHSTVVRCFFLAKTLQRLFGPFVFFLGKKKSYIIMHAIPLLCHLFSF